MNRVSLYVKTSLFIFLLMAVLKSYGQDTIVMDSLKTTDFYFTGFEDLEVQMPFDYLHHWPDEADDSIKREYGYLIKQLPDSNNYDKYHSLACSLWALNDLATAEEMFLNIINSKEKYYLATRKYSSDIAGDTVINIYGYGSVSFNYKNSAAIYLTKINIEKGKFDTAFSFLEEATKKYITTYNCGTGYRSQQDEYTFLYGRIYEGQKLYDKVMKLLLPECLTRNDEIIVRVIKRKYSREQIQDKLRQAEKSMKLEFDDEPSVEYLEYYDTNIKAERTDTIVSYSATATIRLFGEKVDIPEPDLKNGERVTKERFLREFRTSSFYKNLTTSK